MTATVRRTHDVESVLVVAAELFTRQGYDGTSMEELARELGLTKGSIYHHVRSKEELLRLAVARALDALFDILAEPQAVTGVAIDRLEHVVRRAVQVMVSELPYVTLLLRVRGNSETERWALQRRREFDRQVTALVAQAAQDGDLRADVDPSLATRLVFGMVNSLSEWYRPGRGQTSPDELADALVAVALSGLRSRSARSRR